jgi:D-serine deaminase-like pyridoxal phosphate-dependent protein
VLTISRKAVDHNISTMATWCADRGVLLAPHGKTTMAPELFRRQLAAGAWGITVATARQAEVAVRAGSRRVLVANELVDEVELATLAAMAQDVEVFVFADSSEGLRRVAEACRAGRARIGVFVELGMRGMRTGVRSADDFLSLLEEVAQCPDVDLAGISAFEGLIPTLRSEPPPPFTGLPLGTDAVEDFLKQVASLISVAKHQGLIGDDAIVTAGGSAAFDVVVEYLGGLVGPLILRSGCYVTHDHGLYRYQSPLQEGNVPGLNPAQVLLPALRLWARVHSAPEDGIVIVGFGRRDANDDFGMPIPLERVCGAHQGETVEGWSVSQMWDQHAMLKAEPSATELGVGDMLTFGISHPCTVFDKWRSVVEINEHDVVVGTLETWF